MRRGSISSSKRSAVDILDGINYLQNMIQAELFTQYELEKWIQNNAELNTMVGQKRIVCVAQDNRDTVFKIAYNIDGINGNCYEYISWLHLVNLAKNGHINQEDLNLFAEVELVDGNPLVIRQEFGHSIPLDPDFQGWLSDNYPGEKNVWSRVPEYIFDTPRLREDCNIIQQILSDFFVASDVHVMQEPKNFGIKTFRGRSGKEEKRLILIDMDQCYPIVVDQQGEIVPLCPKCGSEMRYVPNKMSKSVNYADVQLQSGVYSCTRETCTNYLIDKIDSNGYVNSNNDTRDSEVFIKYIEEDARDRVMEDVAMYCYRYIPVNFCENINIYKDAVESEVGAFITDYWGNLLPIAYNNYANYMVGNYLATNAEEILAVDKELENRDFAGYVNGISEVVPSQSENDPYSRMLITILYLQNRCSGDYGRFARIISARDFKEFIELVSPVLVRSDDQYVETMYDWLRLY